MKYSFENAPERFLPARPAKKLMASIAARKMIMGVNVSAVVNLYTMPV
jgi:hypothetical protein